MVVQRRRAVIFGRDTDEGVPTNNRQVTARRLVTSSTHLVRLFKRQFAHIGDYVENNVRGNLPPSLEHVSRAS